MKRYHNQSGNGFLLRHRTIFNKSLWYAAHNIENPNSGAGGCFILPYSDQPPEMKEQSALIVRYPKPFTISGDTYNFFILWADYNHIRRLQIHFLFWLHELYRLLSHGNLIIHSCLCRLELHLSKIPLLQAASRHSML